VRPRAVAEAGGVVGRNGVVAPLERPDGAVGDRVVVTVQGARARVVADRCKRTGPSDARRTLVPHQLGREVADRRSSCIPRPRTEVRLAWGGWQLYRLWNARIAAVGARTV